jgi:GT2 family glycosyltransferase
MLKNQSLSIQVLDIISTLIEAAEYMYGYADVRKFEQLETTATDMIDRIQTLYPVTNKIKEEIPFISSPISCENLIYSINNILKFVKTRSQRVCSKIEFELIPILQDFYYDFYFFTCVFGNKEKEKKHYAEEFISMIGNHYIDQSMKTGKYKYDISISVLAYNKLEYTKNCIESIIKYTPSHINYELILIDNGSNDGTYEYFESLSPTKIFTLKHNSLNIVTGAVSRIYEGRYLLSISNDVIVTENYLDNLIGCIESDSKIAMIVPTTPNISNLQTVPAQYSTLEEMHNFAKLNNISDPIRWEERTRLCNPLTFYRSDIILSSQGVGASDKYFVYSEFCDDAVALRLRRAGYKLILAKDCYCYHFGSVTLRESQAKENTLEKSRKLFIERYGVDAWSTGFCYDEELMKALTIKVEEGVNILGINSGFGSNPLKIKTLYKEAGNKDVQLFFVTDDDRYVQDLQAYSENVRYANDTTVDVFDDIYFDYILLEGNVEKIINISNNFNNIKNKIINKGGTLVICATKRKEIEILNKLKADKKITGYNCYWFLWIC